MAVWAVKLYILTDTCEPVVAANELEYMAWMASNHQGRIRQTHHEGVKVSTIFLGVTVRYDLLGRPLLFETMVFGGALDRLQVQYATIGEAQLGHVRLLARVKQECQKNHQTLC